MPLPNFQELNVAHELLHKIDVPKSLLLQYKIT